MPRLRDAVNAQGAGDDQLAAILEPRRPEALDCPQLFGWHLSPGRRYDDEASIIYPYWRFGSAGIGMVLIRYYSLLGDERYRDFIEKIFLDLNRKYAVYPGLFIGLAGVGETLLDFHRFTGEARFQRAAYRIATGLSLFRIEREEGLAFPGDGLVKICCDLATGSAGVGRFFHRLIHGGPTPMVLDELLAGQCSPRVVAEPTKSLMAKAIPRARSEGYRYD